MSKFDVVGKYNSLSDGGRVIATLGIGFIIFAGYYIGLSILQYLLASMFSIYYTKIQLFIAAMCWGIFEGLSGAGMRGGK